MSIGATKEELEVMQDKLYTCKLKGYCKDRFGKTFASVVSLTSVENERILMKRYGRIPIMTYVEVLDLPKIGIFENRKFRQLPLLQKRRNV